MTADNAAYNRACVDYWRWTAEADAAQREIDRLAGVHASTPRWQWLRRREIGHAMAARGLTVRTGRAMARACEADLAAIVLRSPKGGA